MGVVANPQFQNGLVLKANTADNISNANSVGLNDILSDALSLSSGNSQTVSGPLSLSNALTANSSATFNGATTLAGATSVTGAVTFSNAVTFNGNVTYTGASVGHVSVVNVVGPYAVQSADRYIIVTYNGAMNVQLPASPVQGRMITVKDGGGNAATFNITITSSQNIDNVSGSVGFVLNQAWASVDLVFNGVAWNVL